MQNENAPASRRQFQKYTNWTEVLPRLLPRRLPPFVTATLPQNPTDLRFWAVLAVDPSACCRRPCDEPGGAARLRQTAS
jgi:hypothetical protein